MTDFAANNICLCSFIKRLSYLSQGERKIDPIQSLQYYFLERPLALSVAHLLGQNKQGLTATELAERLAYVSTHIIQINVRNAPVKATCE